MQRLEMEIEREEKKRYFDCLLKGDEEEPSGSSATSESEEAEEGLPSSLPDSVLQS